MALDEFGEPISTYDLNNTGMRRSLQRLEEESRYNPRPYDLGFQAELRKARKNSNANN